MRKIAIIFLFLIWSVAVLANPIVPQLFSELYFDSTEWKIELNGTWLEGHNVPIVISSLTDSAATDTSVHLSGDFPVLSPTDMETILYINPTGDHLRIGIPYEYGVYWHNDFTFGANGVIAAPRAGESIAFSGSLEASEYKYFLDSSPTLGALNDCENSKGTIQGAVIDKNGTPISRVTVEYSCVCSSGLENTIAVTDENGRFEFECLTARQLFSFRHDGYEFLSSSVQIWPDSIVNATFTLTAYSANYQNYFPLQVGNHWEYTKYLNGVYSYKTIDISRTVSISNRTYYILGTDTVGYDSLKNVVIYKNQRDSLLYPLSLSSGDSILTIDSLWMVKATYNQTPVIVEAGKFTDNVIIDESYLGTIVAIFPNPSKKTYFSRDVGLVKSYYKDLSGNTDSTELYYAYVNGTTYYHYNYDKITPSPIPVQYDLSITNYPNPFNSSTTLQYHLIKTDNVQLSVYDLKGRLVERLFSGRQSAGDYHFIWSGGNLPSGVYFFSLQSGERHVIQKCMLLK
jgi:hypothetical protein